MKIDLLCEDYPGAEANRGRVKLKKNISEYIRIEALVKSWPRNKRLPDELLGTLPTVGKHEARELHGFHEVEE